MTKAIETWVNKNEDKFKSEAEKEHLIEFLIENYGQKNSINFNYEQCVEKSEDWVHSLNKKTNRLNVGKTKLIMGLDNGFSIVQLLDQAAKNYEGLEMGHCVASHGYTAETIFSLRDINNSPHCTFEIKGESIYQIKGKQNRPVLSRYVPYVVSFLKSKDFKSNRFDLSQILIPIGFKSFSNEDVKVIKKYFDNLSIIENFVSLENSIMKFDVSKFSAQMRPSHKSFLSKIFDNKLYIEDIAPFLNLGAHPEAYKFIELYNISVKLPEPSAREYETLLSKDKNFALECLKKYSVRFEDKCRLVKILLNYSLEEEAINYFNSCDKIPLPNNISGYNDEIDDLIIKKAINREIFVDPAKMLYESYTPNDILSHSFLDRMSDEIFKKILKAYPSLPISNMLISACKGSFDENIIFNNTEVSKEDLSLAAKYLVQYALTGFRYIGYKIPSNLGEKVMDLINRGAVFNTSRSELIYLEKIPGFTEVVNVLKNYQSDSTYSIQIDSEDKKETLTIKKIFDSKEKRADFLIRLEKFLANDETEE